MAESGAPRRLLLEDSRRNGNSVRATWHPDGKQFVVSTWHADVCVGAVRLDPIDAARLVGHLAAGLATGIAVPQPSAKPSHRRSMNLWHRVRRRLRGAVEEPEGAAVELPMPWRRSA